MLHWLLLLLPLLLAMLQACRWVEAQKGGGNNSVWWISQLLLCRLVELSSLWFWFVLAVFVETLDRCFKNVCELDIVYNFNKVNTYTLLILFITWIFVTGSEVMSRHALNPCLSGYECALSLSGCNQLKRSSPSRFGLCFEVFCQKLMKSVGSHGSSSLLFVLKLMVWNFVSKDSHKSRIALIVMLPFELL